MTDLVHFFEAELLGSMREKYQQFVIGLRAQLENIVSNKALRTIMTGRSDVNIDEHLETGGTWQSIPHWASYVKQVMPSANL